MIRNTNPGLAMFCPFCALILALTAALYSAPVARDEIVFEDVERQTRQFMEWERAIKLTARQEAVKKQALEALPAPCCSDNSAYTCCCSCNISRTIWGLSNYLIAEKQAGAAQVSAKVAEWVKFINPGGYSGVACYRGGCRRAFKNDGCGGMNPNQLVF